MHKKTRTTNGMAYGALEQAGHGEVSLGGHGEQPRQETSLWLIPARSDGVSGFR
jgi:hypothetical protein